MIRERTKDGVEQVHNDGHAGALLWIGGIQVKGPLELATGWCIAALVPKCNPMRTYETARIITLVAKVDLVWFGLPAMTSSYDYSIWAPRSACGRL